MELTPNKIREDYKNNKINRHSAIELLISLIENSESKDIRLDSIVYLGAISGKNDRIFKLFENLLISDSNAKLRKFSAEFIKNNFIDKGLEPMKWTIQHEPDYDCLITVIETLVKINNNGSKLALIDEIKRIRKKKYLDNKKQNSNKQFKKDLKQLFKNKKIKTFSCKELAEIIINFKTIVILSQTFYTVFFKLNCALVVELDLSEIGWNVNVWKQPYADRIQSISEIVGLKNLTHLKTLDLSNNRIKDLKELPSLKNLTHLYISNNKIEVIEHLNHIKEISSLKYLDISGNKIADKINIQDFDRKLKIKYKKSLYFQ